jgi:hypothetical protein
LIWNVSFKSIQIVEWCSNFIVNGQTYRLRYPQIMAFFLVVIRNIARKVRSKLVVSWIKNVSSNLLLLWTYCVKKRIAFLSEERARIDVGLSELGQFKIHWSFILESLLGFMAIQVIESKSRQRLAHTHWLLCQDVHLRT